MSSEEYYHQGNEHRRQGDFPAAMNCYLQAIALDPNSPAVVAEKMLEDIMNFYCKDIYNPWQCSVRAKNIVLNLYNTHFSYEEKHWSHCR